MRAGMRVGPSYQRAEALVGLNGLALCLVASMLPQSAIAIVIGRL